ncbi:DUF642 domain-containing protein [Streptomyces sp. NPDC006285]|uniref:DUF642 domain-containing protein n=1 Tax=Streptomyces sp. NPDC006285 TaxID=3364742 RepID=UPI00367BEA05
MRVRKSSRAVLAVVVASAALAAAVPAQAAPDGPGEWLPLTNPSFNQPYLGTNNYQNVGAGSSAIPGRAVVRGDVDVESAKWAKTGSLSQAVSLNGNGQGAIVQAVPTTPGRRVEVTFRPGTETYSKCDTNLPLRLAVTANGDSEVIFNPGRPDHDQPHWRLATYTFTASDRITHLGFESLVQGPCGAVLTDVTAEQ